MRRLALVLATLVALCAAPSPARAGAPAAVTYRPPVDAPVVDPFRPADPNWTSGNRGLEYATTPGTLGGRVGGRRGGLRRAGRRRPARRRPPRRRAAHQLLLPAAGGGEAGREGHPGPDRGYCRQPVPLRGPGRRRLSGPRPAVRRRPTAGPPGARRAAAATEEAQERAGLARMVAGWGSRAIAAGGAALEWARDAGVEKVLDKVDEYRGLARLGHEGMPLNHVGRFVEAAWEWRKAQETCTPESVPAPRLAQRHMAVMVAGLGSSSEGDSIDAIDTAALGYARSRRRAVTPTSAAPGSSARTSPPTPPPTSTTRPSTSASCSQRVAAEHPGVPIDIIAHSQGGIVARTALTDEVDGHDPRLPQVRLPRHPQHTAPRGADRHAGHHGRPHRRSAAKSRRPCTTPFPRRSILRAPR